MAELPESGAGLYDSDKLRAVLQGAGRAETGRAETGRAETGRAESDRAETETSLFDAGLLDPLRQGSRQMELTDDAAWLQALVDVELALSRALVDVGLAPEWMRDVCAQLADARSLDLQAIAAEGRGGGNPVIPLVKHLSRAADAVRSGASDHVHVGATSQDILDSAAMLVAARVAAELRSQLAALATTLIDLADAHRTTVMAGRTLGQQASPTSFGFVVAGWLDAVVTVLVRLDALIPTLPAQLGGAVGNLAVLTEVAAARSRDAASAAQPASPTAIVDAVLERFAAHLGLAVPRLSWHTNRLPITELGSLLAQVTGVVGNLASNVTVLSRTEIGEVSERLGAGEGGSSAMPHKRNPVTAVLIVAAARQTPALLATLHASLLSDDQRPAGAWHAEWQPLRDLERHALAAVTASVSLVGRLDVDAERMLANLELTDGLIFSERVTTILAEAIGKAPAFTLVEQASRESVSTRRPLKVTLSGLLAGAGTDDTLRARVWAACDVQAGVDHAVDHSPAAIDRVIARAQAAIQKSPAREGTARP